jgi:phage terminase small subunit
MSESSPVETAAATTVNPLEELTPLMLAFVEEYLLDLNASAAYRRAGGSAKSARVLGPAMLRDPRVKPLVERRMLEREKETRVRSYRVLEELAVVAFSDHEHYRIDANGRLKLAAHAPRGAMRAIARVKTKRRVIPQGDDEQGKPKPPIVETDVEYSLWPKGPAITDAMRKLGMFIDRHEVTGAGGGPIELSTHELRDRVARRIDGIASRIAVNGDGHE